MLQFSQTAGAKERMSSRARACLGRWGHAASWALGLLIGAFPHDALAVPSFARQTGMPCVMCHIGGFGPQLTPFGVRFKLGGYTLSDGKDGKIPVAAMLVGSWSHTEKGQDPAPAHFDGNDNAALQEASVFLAGRMTDRLGSFIQTTYSGIERKTMLDNVDLRYVGTITVWGKETTLGLSLNNNPTVQDPFNTLPAWRFPFMSSELTPEFMTPIIENLGQSVAGLSVYGYWNNTIYAEIGAYDSLSRSALDTTNADDPGKFKGLGRYWRLVVYQDRGSYNYSAGLGGFNVDIQPDRDDLGTADRFRDLGIDASYQYLGDRQHILTFNANYLHERQNLDFTFNNLDSESLRNPLGEYRHGSYYYRQLSNAYRLERLQPGFTGTTLPTADPDNFLNQLRLALSYYYRQTWGTTASLFRTHGSIDAALNGNSLSGHPDTSGYVLQADWTPWGKPSSWAAPFANVRLGAQYTGYRRFNGGSHYLDDNGNDRRAGSNNTLFVFLWNAI